MTSVLPLSAFAIVLQHSTGTQSSPDNLSARSGILIARTLFGVKTAVWKLHLCSYDVQFQQF
jgi:hypothetical protein